MGLSAFLMTYAPRPVITIRLQLIPRRRQRAFLEHSNVERGSTLIMKAFTGPSTCIHRLVCGLFGWKM
jgi:hypothetical protein